MKKYFNTSLYLLMPYVLSYGFWYLIGSFLSASWMPADWSFELKNTLAIWAFLFGWAFAQRMDAEYAKEQK